MPINSETHDWESIKIYLNGVPVAGITEINYKDKKDKKLVYAAGSRPVGSGHGNYEASGDFTLTRAAADRFELVAKAAGKKSLDYIPFTIVVAWADRVAQGQFVGQEFSPMKAETLVDVEITDRDQGAKQNDTQLVRKYTFIAGDIR